MLDQLPFYIFVGTYSVLFRDLEGFGILLIFSIASLLSFVLIRNRAWSFRFNSITINYLGKCFLVSSFLYMLAGMLFIYIPLGGVATIFFLVGIVLIALDKFTKSRV